MSIFQTNVYNTAGEQRIITDLAVVKVFGEEWQSAWAHYKALHQADKGREYYVLHTDRPELNIGVINAFGLTTP